MKKILVVIKKFDSIKNLIINSELIRIIRKTNIKTRLIISFLALSFIPLIITAIISYVESSSAIKNKIGSSSEQILKQTHKNISSQSDKIISMVNTIVLKNDTQEFLSNFNEMDDYDLLSSRDALEDSLLTTMGNNSDIDIVKIFNNDNEEVLAYGSLEIDEKIIKSLREKAEDAKGEGVWIVDKENKGKLYLTKIIKSRKSGENIGYIILREDSKVFLNSYKDIDIGEGADILVLNDNNELVVSNSTIIKRWEEEYEKTEFVDKLTKNLKENKTDSYNISDKLISYTYDKKNGWYIIGAIPFKYLNSESNDIGLKIITISVISLIFSIVIALVISLSISEPLNKLMNYMKKSKEGNLNLEIEDKNKDEISLVLNNFSSMLKNLRKIIMNTNTISSGLLEKSEYLNNASEVSYQTSEQIGYAINEVANGTTEQASDTVDCLSEMSQLSDNMNSVEDKLSIVNSTVESAKKITKKSKENINLLLTKSSEVKKASDIIEKDINDLRDDMKSIKKVVNTIITFSKKTKMIALNASIEAARAGEAGLGFSVVAKEIKILAEKTRELSDGISKIVISVQDKTIKTVEAVSEYNEINKQQNDYINITGDSFSTIFDSMSNILEYVDELSVAVKNSMENRNKTMSSIENISSVSHQTATSVEEISASTQEQLASTDRLYSLAKDLNEVASNLQESVSIFKV
jgi:methyl-accepting chemotaxis protein